QRFPVDRKRWSPLPSTPDRVTFISNDRHLERSSAPPNPPIVPPPWLTASRLVGVALWPDVCSGLRPRSPRCCASSRPSPRPPPAGQRLWRGRAAGARRTRPPPTSQSWAAARTRPAAPACGTPPPPPAPPPPPRTPRCVSAPWPSATTTTGPPSFPTPFTE